MTEEVPLSRPRDTRKSQAPTPVPATITVPATGVTLTGSGRAVVVQSGNELTINGSLTFGGVESVLPAVTGTINETGFFTLTASGAVPGPPAVSDECGVLTITSQSLTFAGRTLTFQEGYQTTFCGSLTIAATLTPLVSGSGCFTSPPSPILTVFAARS